MQQFRRQSVTHIHHRCRLDTGFAQGLLSLRIFHIVYSFLRKPQCDLICVFGIFVSADAAKYGNGNSYRQNQQQDQHNT